MAADENNEKQVFKEDWLDEEFMKDEQTKVKRKNYWVFLKINLYTLVLQ